MGDGVWIEVVVMLESVAKGGYQELISGCVVKMNWVTSNEKDAYKTDRIIHFDICICTFAFGGR